MEGTTPGPPSQVKGVLAAGQHVQDGTEESGHLPPCFSSLSSRTRTTSEPQNTENDLSGYFSFPPKMVNNTAKREMNSSHTGEASALANFSCPGPYSTQLRLSRPDRLRSNDPVLPLQRAHPCTGEAMFPPPASPHDTGPWFSQGIRAEKGLESSD